MRNIDQLPVSLIAADRAQTRAAAGLTARHPVAYADCFAAALAVARKARLVTGDPAFRETHAARLAPPAMNTEKGRPC